jgi:hypothetical protein
MGILAGTWAVSGLKLSICAILGHFLVGQAPVSDAENALIRAGCQFFPPLSFFFSES